MTDFQVHVYQDFKNEDAQPSFEFESSWTSSLLGKQSSGEETNGIIVTQHHLPGDVLRKACFEFDASDAVIGILPTSSDLKFVWSQLPNSIAALSMPLENRCAVFSKPADLSGVFCESSHPIWESICRLTINDPSMVTLLDSDGLTSNLAEISSSCQLPSVNPTWPPTDLEWMENLLHAIDWEQILPDATNATEVTALHSGLWQLHDFLDDSHSASQSIEGEGSGNGDYWHAIMHRREPDYSNGKYWFRRVGQHARFSEVAAIADQLLSTTTASSAESWRSRLSGSKWDAFAFVDLCEQLATGGDPELVVIAERLQWCEMLILLVDCYEQASG